MYKPVKRLSEEQIRHIRAVMIRAGVTGTDIAERTGKSKSAVSQTITGRIRTPEIRAAIAEATKRTEAELWPEDAFVSAGEAAA